MTNEVISYELAPEWVKANGEFAGGVISLGDRDLDVGAELAANGGTITVDATDALALVHLDAYPALQRVATPKTAKPEQRKRAADSTDEPAATPTKD